MLSIRCYITTVVFATSLIRIHGFASWMATDFCDRPLRLAEIIMNQPVVESDERIVKVFRGETELVSGKDTYVPGEELIVTITEKKKSQFVFETTENGQFVKGGCEGRRSTKSPSKLVMPDDATDPVKIWAAAEGSPDNDVEAEALAPSVKNGKKLEMPDPVLPPKIKFEMPDPVLPPKRKLSESSKAGIPESIEPKDKRKKISGKSNGIPAEIPASISEATEPDHEEIVAKAAPKSKLHASDSSSARKVHLSKSAIDALPPSKETHDVHIKTEVNHIHLGEERVLTPIKVEDLSTIASKDEKGALGANHHRSSRMKVGEASLKSGKVYDRDQLKLALRGHGLHASPIEPATHNHVFMLLYIAFAAALVLVLYKFFLGRFKIKRYLLKLQGKDIDK